MNRPLERKTRFFNEDSGGWRDVRVTLLYIRYVFYAMMRATVRKDTSRHAYLMAQIYLLRTKIDDEKKIRIT